MQYKKVISNRIYDKNILMVSSGKLEEVPFTFYAEHFPVEVIEKISEYPEFLDRINKLGMVMTVTAANGNKALITFSHPNRFIDDAKRDQGFDMIMPLEFFLDSHLYSLEVLLTKYRMMSDVIDMIHHSSSSTTKHGEIDDAIYENVRYVKNRNVIFKGNRQEFINGISVVINSPIKSVDGISIAAKRTLNRNLKKIAYLIEHVLSENALHEKEVAVDNYVRKYNPQNSGNYVDYINMLLDDASGFVRFGTYDYLKRNPMLLVLCDTLDITIEQDSSVVTFNIPWGKNDIAIKISQDSFVESDADILSTLITQQYLIGILEDIKPNANSSVYVISRDKEMLLQSLLKTPNSASFILNRFTKNDPQKSAEIYLDYEHDVVDIRVDAPIALDRSTWMSNTIVGTYLVKFAAELLAYIKDDNEGLQVLLEEVRDRILR